MPTRTTVTNLLDRAMDLHEDGRFDEAEILYRQALKLQPNEPLALHQIGLIEYSRGNLAGGIAQIALALEVRPAWPEALTNLGMGLLAQDRVEAAIAVLRKAVALRPAMADAQVNLGNALRAAGLLAEAILAYEAAVAVRPDMSAAHVNLGASLRESGRAVDAERACRRAIAIDPSLAAAQVNMAIALVDQGRSEEAVAAAREGARLAPTMPEAHIALSQALAMPGANQPDAVLAACDAALLLRPGDAAALVNRSVALRDKGRVPEALAATAAAIKARPDFQAAHSNRLYGLYYHPGQTPATILAEHRAWGSHYADPLSAAGPLIHHDRTSGRRLRVGYVSPDFRRHPIGQLMLPVLMHHDHSAFEIHCYSDVRRPDPLTEQLRTFTDGWHETVGMSDAMLAQQVRADRIDVLVDQTMHMAGSRLLAFARRPAPLQVTWLAYPGTTGLAAMDARLTDPFLDPSGADDAYAERSIRLPHTFWCYDPLTTQPETNPLPAVNGDGVITFGCLNNFCKVSDLTVVLWKGVLQAVPRSRFLVLAPPGDHRAELVAALGVDPGRVEFADPRPRDQYLRLYHQIDFCLDTYPYGGHTTGLDALWMGVPAVSLVGPTAVSRAALSQLSNLGMADEWAAHRPSQYLQLAQRWAGDLPRLAAVRAGLRARMQASPLMDGRLYTRGVEAAFRQLWEAYCAA